MKDFFLSLTETDTLVLIVLALLALIDPSMRDAVGGGLLAYWARSNIQK